MSADRERVSMRAYRRAGYRRILVDLALTAVVLVVAEIAILAGRETGSLPRAWPAYLLGCAMSAPVLLRRRNALLEVYLVGAALLAYYSIGYPGFPPAVVLAVPLYDAATTRRPWQALPVPALLLGAGVVVALRNGTSPLDTVDVFLPQFGLVAVALLLGALVRSRRDYTVQYRERLRAVAAERELEAERRVVAERLRIARELHDTVAHALSTISVQSGTAVFTLDQQPDQARAALTAIRATAKEALAEMRTTLAVLRSPGEPAVSPDRSAGLDRMPALLAAVRAAGLQVEVDDPGRAEPLPDDVDHAAYRIVQEALTNVLRHAGPRATARVQVALAAERLVVEVTDDGVGPADGDRPDEPEHGHGLAGMRERATALGGRVETGPAGGRGFRVFAELPIGVRP